MNDAELLGLATLVHRESVGIATENCARVSRGQAIAYEVTVSPNEALLIAELTRRGVFEAREPSPAPLPRRVEAAVELAEACIAREPRAVAGPGLHACWFCGKDAGHAHWCLFAAYRAARDAEKGEAGS